MGAMSVLALLVLLAHATFLLVQRDWRSFLHWALTCICAVLLLGPFLMALTRQREQVWWISIPRLAELRSFAADQFGGSLRIIVVLGALVGLSLAVRGRRQPAIENALLLGVSWAILPPLVLWLASQREPLWQDRYLLPSVPGTALAVAAALALFARSGLPRVIASESLRRVGAAGVLSVGLTVLAASSVPMQVTARGALGHGEDVEAVADYLAIHGTHGDGVIYVPEELRIVALLHPEQTAWLADPALDSSPEQSGTITGRELRSPGTITMRIAAHHRLWIIRSGDVFNPRSSDPAKLGALHLYTKSSEASVGRFNVDLYVSFDREMPFPQARV
jgi:mannosyltransferase